MKHIKIGGRLNLVSVAALLGLILVLTLSLLRLNIVMREGVSDQTRKVVETAHSILVHYQKLESAGKLSRADAQSAAYEAIRSMRYGGTEYFWINDMSPHMIMHPTSPALEGQDLSKKTDSDGVLMFQQFVQIVRDKGEGFVEYRWAKPGIEGAHPKISFVKGFAPWGLVIGSGVYIDDIRAAVVRVAWAQGSIVLVIILVVGLLNWAMSRSITKPVLALTDRMGSLASGDTGAIIPGLDRRDEIGEMAKALSVFRDTAIARNHAEATKAQADAEQNLVVATLSEQLSRLSKGDLTAAITVEFPSTYGILKNNYNDALDNLRNLINGLSQTTHSIRTGANEIAIASEDLARRTESNAASLEQTSAALTQVEDRLRSTAQAAGKTVEQTHSTMKIVGTGRRTATEAANAMTRVAESAHGIDQVIEGVDKIAFQTRVLAMNAAVEAGRAGDAGRGFAVVADLVSALAMRCEEEAKRAREQLTATQTDIVSAVDAVQQMDGSLANITGSVEEVHQLVAAMASDNQAQSATISQIASAVGTMDRSTQQNAAMVEQTSAAARNLATEVNVLAGSTARFTT